MSVHTRIDQPITVRKDLLECAIDCAEILRSGENVKRIHAETEVIKKKLKVVMDKLRVLNYRFHKELPQLPKEKKVEIREEKEFAPIRIDPKPKKQPKPRSMSPEERANRELEALRHKIESL